MGIYYQDYGHYDMWDAFCYGWEQSESHDIEEMTLSEKIDIFDAWLEEAE